MFHALGLFGLGFAGLTAFTGLLGIAYAVLVIVMIVDGVLRPDVEYPGTEPNRKVLWVLGMVLLHPVAIAYFFLVYSKIKRGSSAVYTACEQTPPPGV